MIRKTVFLLFSLTIMFSMVLAGCSDSEKTKGKATKDGKEQVTLNVWTRIGGDYKDLFDDTLKEFNKKYPNIKIKVNEVPSTEYAAAFTAAAQGKKLPDLFQNPPSINFKKMVDQNMLHPLDDVVGNKKDDFVPGVWTEGQSTIDGKIYGIPNHEPRGHVAMIFYNKKLLANAGYKRVPKHMSWDDLEKMAKASKKANPNTEGIELSVSSGWIIRTETSSMEVAVNPNFSAGYDASGRWNFKTGQKGSDPEADAEVFKYLKKLKDEGLFAPGLMEDDSSTTMQAFKDGKSAFYMNESEDIKGLQDSDIGDDIGVAYVPTKDGKPYYSGYSGETNVNWEVAKNTEHFEEVKTFLKFIMDYEYKELVKRGMVSSPLKSINESVKSDSRLFNETRPMIDETIKVVPNAASKNLNTIDVTTEYSNTAPTTDDIKILQGYLTDQLSESQMKEQLKKYSEDQNKILKDAIKKVNASGKKVSIKDFTFPDWVPFEDYKK